MMNFVKTSLLSLIFCLLTGCIPMPKKALVTAKPVEPIKSELVSFVYDGPSNTELLIASIHKIELDFLKHNLIPPGSSVLVASMEDPADSEKSDFPATPKDKKFPLVEDGLTIKLTQSGLNAIERDIDILSRLYHESNDKYLISIAPDLSLKKVIQEIESRLDDKKEENNNKTMESMIREVITNFKVSNMPFVRYPFNGKKPLQEGINLDAADYLLSFRVLECDIENQRYLLAEKPITVTASNKGAQTVSSNFIRAKKESFIRVARTKLHLRLTDQKGRILWSDFVSGEVREETPLDAMGQLKSNQQAYFKN